MVIMVSQEEHFMLMLMNIFPSKNLQLTYREVMEEMDKMEVMAMMEKMAKTEPKRKLKND